MITWKEILNFSKKGSPDPDYRILKTDEEWRDLLTPEQFEVTRRHGTERPFEGEYCASFDPGLYGCVCCQTPLFDSSEKFDSGTGWPSFTQPVKENAIRYVTDMRWGMTRVETLCNTCDAHLGHVFPDGPEPSGLRYCINSAALLKLDKAG